MTKTDNHFRTEEKMVLDPWSGAWMWISEETECRNAYGLFRLRFDLEAAATLNLRCAADSWYGLYLDGEFVQRGPVRGFSSRPFFDEIALDMGPGSHVLAVLVHHIGEICATHPVGAAGLRIEGEVGAKNLRQLGEWRCFKAESWREDLPELMSHFGFWEDRDLGRREAGWTNPDFDDSGWGTPVLQKDTPMRGKWTPRDIPPFRYSEVSGRRCAQGVWSGSGSAERPSLMQVRRGRRRVDEQVDLDGVPRQYQTFDFGRTVTGYLRLRVACEASGTEVLVAYDEFLQPNGAVDAERTYARFADRFVLSAGDTVIEGVQPRGFRFLTVDVGGPARILGAWVLEERYPYDDTRRTVFSASDASLSAMYSKDLLTADLCTLDTFVDCPNRERVHFMEAVHPAARTAFFGFGDTAIVRRSLLLGAQSQLPDGAINGFSPSDRTNLAFAGSSLLWLHTLLDYWEHTGDEGFLEDLAKPLKRLWEKFDSCQNEEGLLSGWESWWDWSPAESNGTLLLNNAFWLWALERMAGVPVLADSAEGHVDAREDLRKTIHRVFWNPERELYRTAIRTDGTPSPMSNQFGNTMAVLTGICPSEHRVPLLQRITRLENLNYQPVGDCNADIARLLPKEEIKIQPFGMHYPASFLVEACFRNGLDHEAHALIRQYWGPYLGQPTFPEVFIPGLNSFLCHDWGCGVAYLLQAYVAGLKPASPGWETICWEPHPGPLDSFHTEVPTPKGAIRAGYRREGGQVFLEADLPEGCRLNVRVGEQTETVENMTSWKGMFSVKSEVRE